MNFIACHDRIIFTLVKKKENKTGLILPETDNDPWVYGKVECKGPNANSVEVGDVILLYKVDGTPLKVDDEIYFTIRDSQVIGIYKKENTND